MTAAPPAGAAKLAVAGLTLDYVNPETGIAHRAVERLDLTVARNEFLCVVGPSGCGKSTLLSAIAGFLAPTSGTILMDGRPVDGPGAERGVVFQEYALLPWMNVLDNAALGLKLRGMGKAQRYEVARRFLGIANLHGVEHKYPHELSGGMKQRVAVARTLANAPEVMLMDEPFAAVDAQTRADLEDLIRDLWHRFKVTTLFVTHDIDESVYLGERVIMLSSSPTVVQEDLVIDLPAERDQLETRSLPRFTELRGHVYEQIQKAKKAAPQGSSSDTDATEVAHVG